MLLALMMQNRSNRTPREMENYKYLGILEADIIKEAEIKHPPQKKEKEKRKKTTSK